MELSRDPEAWARLGRALREARERQGLSQQRLAEAAGVSAMALQSAEKGKVPKRRMPFTLQPIAAALGWPAGSVESVLNGGEPPGGWTDRPAAVDDEQVAAILTGALVRSLDTATAAEIREATRLAVDELRRHGVLPSSIRATQN